MTDPDLHLVIAVRDALHDAVACVVDGGPDEVVNVAPAFGWECEVRAALIVCRGVYLAIWGRPVATTVIGSTVVLRRTS